MYPNKESQLAGGRPVGDVEASSRNCTRNYMEQIHLVVRAGLQRTRPLCYHFRDLFYALIQMFLSFFAIHED